MAQNIQEEQTAFGLAALSICESLLTSLRDLKIIGEQEVVGILKDASTAHHQSTKTGLEADSHRIAAAVIDKILARNNSVRHS